MADTAFRGNSIFLQNGDPVMEANAIAAKLRSGNFGPYPNSTAPPNFVLPREIPPQAMLAALRSNLLPNIAGGRPPAAAPATVAPPAPPIPAWMLPQPFGAGGDIGVGPGSIGQGYGYDSGGLAGMSGWGGIGFGATDTGIY